MKQNAFTKDLRLTQYARAAGCAAKLSPRILSQVLNTLPPNTDPCLLVGTETSDDAAVYKISDDIALVHTIDFFPPVVDDPYIFGQIAAANALSDIYAMGAEPLTALNIVAYPSCLGAEILKEILRGGADKVHEAEASLAGGHSINDNEPKYGLSITGIIHPDKILKNSGAQAGDLLVLTKPLGTGLINTAAKSGKASKEAVAAAVKSMCTLNKRAKRICGHFTVHACTDITGFSLAGHSLEMARGSNLTLDIEIDSLPLLEGAAKYAAQGFAPSGTARNRNYADVNVSLNWDAKTSKDELKVWSDILFDPQTSGGLLLSLPENEAAALLKALMTPDADTSAENILPGAIIGRVVQKQDAFVRFFKRN